MHRPFVLSTRKIPVLHRLVDIVIIKCNLFAELTEQQKDINRTAADHVEVKIRAVGLDPAQSDLFEAWRNLTAEQLDMLSRMEHERWSAPLWINGYTAGVRNDALRKHPNLIPYDELDADTQAYDTDQVKIAGVYYTAALEASS